MRFWHFPKENTKDKSAGGGIFNGIRIFPLGKDKGKSAGGGKTLRFVHFLRETQRGNLPEAEISRDSDIFLRETQRKICEIHIFPLGKHKGKSAGGGKFSKFDNFP